MWDKLANRREPGSSANHDTDEHSDRLNDSTRLDDSCGIMSSRSTNNLKSVRIGGQTEIQDTLVSYNIQNLDSKLQESDKNEDIIKNLLDIRADIIAEALSFQTKLEKLDQQILSVAESLRSNQRLAPNENENEHHSQNRNDTNDRKYYAINNSNQSETINFNDSSVSLLNSYDISMLSAEFQKSRTEVPPKETSRNNSKSSDDGKSISARKVLVKQKQEEMQSPNLSENARLKQTVCPTLENYHEEPGKLSRGRKNGSRNSALPLSMDFQLTDHLSEKDYQNSKTGNSCEDKLKNNSHANSSENLARCLPFPGHLSNESLDSPTPAYSTVETSFSFIDMDEKPVVPSNLPEF